MRLLVSDESSGKIVCSSVSGKELIVSESCDGSGRVFVVDGNGFGWSEDVVSCFDGDGSEL